MSITISALTAATTIDGTADYFPIDTASLATTQRINRATFLGVSGTPADLSTAQSFTNKILDNTNTLTIKDANLTIQNTTDPTKQVLFSLANITTATSRTISLPNASVTLSSLTGTETLTNKTLTSPVITGGTIDNTTITVDSIAGHTSSSIVSVAGLSISSGVLNTANAVTATSIAAGGVQPQALVAGTGSGWSWQAFTPTWTNLTVGTGGSAANAGAYCQTGKTVFVRSSTTLGTTGFSVSSFPSYVFPVTPKTTYNSQFTIIGQVFCQITGGTNFIGFIATAYVSGSVTPVIITSAAGALGIMTNVVPGTFIAGSNLQFHYSYEAA